MLGKLFYLSSPWFLNKVRTTLAPTLQGCLNASMFNINKSLLNKIIRTSTSGSVRQCLIYQELSPPLPALLTINKLAFYNSQLRNTIVLNFSLLKKLFITE